MAAATFNSPKAAWKELKKHGYIKNFKRKDDPRRFNAYLKDGLIYLECNHGISATVTIDIFLYSFMENLPCDYPQYIKP